MEELIKYIEDARIRAWEYVDQMQESNRIRESKGERLFYDDFSIGKAHGYANGLTHALQKINQYIQQNKPTEKNGRTN